MKTFLLAFVIFASSTVSFAQESTAASTHSPSHATRNIALDLLPSGTEMTIPMNVVVRAHTSQLDLRRSGPFLCTLFFESSDQDRQLGELNLRIKRVTQIAWYPLIAYRLIGWYKVNGKAQPGMEFMCMSRYYSTLADLSRLAEINGGQLKLPAPKPF